MSSILTGVLTEGDVIKGPWGDNPAPTKPVAIGKSADIVTLKRKPSLNAAKMADTFLTSRYAPESPESMDEEELIEDVLRFLLDTMRDLTKDMTFEEIYELAKRISRESLIQLDLYESSIMKGIVDETELDENLRKWFKEKWVRFGPDGKIRGSCARGDDSEGKPKCLPQSKAHSLGKKGRKYAASKKRREDPNPERTGKAKNVATKKKTNEEKKPDFMKSGNMKPFTASGEEIPGSVNTLEKLLVKAKERGIKLNYDSIDQMMQAVAKKHHLTGDELHNEFVAKHHMIPDNWIVKQLDEACWKGYHKEGMKTMFGKKYPNCVKNTNEEKEVDETCPHCGGELVSEEMMNEKQDACYHKVKSRYKVWPSAYASGALVQCRKKGASNWGTGGKKKNESSPVKENRFGTPIEPGYYVVDKFSDRLVYQERFKTHFDAEGYLLRKIPSRNWNRYEVAYISDETGLVNAENWYGLVKAGIVDPNKITGFVNKQYNESSRIAYMEETAYDKDSSDDQLDEKWTKKYKDSINCSNPKGFSQKAHCAGKKKNESSIMKGIVDEAGSPSQQAAIAIAMKKRGEKPKNEATYTSPGDTKLPMDEAYRKARQITKQIKYDQTVSEILVSIQMLAEKAGIPENELQGAEDEVYEASRALESAVYGLDEVFKEALERQRYAQNDEELEEDSDMRYAAEKEMEKPYFGEGIVDVFRSKENARKKAKAEKHKKVITDTLAQIDQVIQAIDSGFYKKANDVFQNSHLAGVNQDDSALSWAISTIYPDYNWADPEDTQFFGMVPATHRRWTKLEKDWKNFRKIPDKYYPEFLESLKGIKRHIRIVLTLGLADASSTNMSEDYTGMYAAEKTPAINPYGGLKDRQFRGSISEISDTKTSTNQTGGFITPEYDDAYQRLKVVAPRLFHYIRNDAPVPLDPILTLKFLSQMRGDEEAVIQRIKQELSKDTKAMYGADHPNVLAERVNRFWKKVINETPTDNPTGASGEGGWRKYKPKPAGEIDEAKKSEFRLKAEHQQLKQLEKINNSTLPHWAKEYLTLLTDPKGKVFKAAYYSFPKGQDARKEAAEYIMQKYKIPQEWIDEINFLKGSHVTMNREEDRHFNWDMPSMHEDTAYAGGMGQGGNAGQSYRKFKPKPSGVIKRESFIMKGLRKEGR